MAIVNRTPDSFYDRGATYAMAAALERVDRVVAEGADMVDVGGVKAAPGDEGEAAGEIRRAAGLGAAIRAAPPPLPISIDTWRAEVAREALAAGADVVNDAWGGVDPDVAGVAAKAGAGIVCTHAGGLPPRTRPHRVTYDDVVADIVTRTTALAEAAVAAGGPGRRGLGGRARPGAGRSGPRLRQEPPALARGNPPAGRAGRDRLAGARRTVEQGLRRRDPRRPAGGTAHRHPGRDRRQRRARPAGLPRARRRRDPADARHGRLHPGRPFSGPHRPRPRLRRDPCPTPRR